MFAISPEELKKRIDVGKVGFMLDLRNEDEFAAWRIEGRSEIETINIPQTDFVGEEERYLGRLPQDRQIVTICAHGDSSRYSAEYLRNHGFDSISLDGGMDAWSELYESHKISDRPDIYQIFRVARGCVSHLVVSGSEAIVIDAVRHVDRFIGLAYSLNARIVHVLDTHLHADHISGGLEIARRTGAQYHICPDDADAAAYSYEPLRDGDVVSFGRSRIETFVSPGHTPGSASFLLDRKFLFTGDTVMKMSIGRPDLGGRVDEWAHLLYDTLFHRYEKFPDDLIVLPAHAASIREQDADGVVRTTIGDARRSGDLYQKKGFLEFLALIKESLPESPDRYQEIRKVNLGLLDPDEAKRKELEIGKNLCGMAKTA
ncbi:MAG: MBL fold metallo-hydrolase [Nitrospiraceae bacterium]|nr:MBL fold metallo-hydrolase [Nitrospiraceae bacterium]MDA8431648.1 MBL fold metallo-hydrolase [Nitrospiraceae bacterium]